MQFTPTQSTARISPPQVDHGEPLSGVYKAGFHAEKAVRASPRTTLTRATLAVDLMNDPQEVQFFSELTERLVRRTAPGPEFVGLLADALSSVRAGRLSPTFFERVATIFATAAYSSELTDLALSVLVKLQSSGPTIAIDSYEGAIIASLDYLSRFEPQLTLVQRGKILHLGLAYGEPIGRLKSGVPDFSDLHRDLDRPIDLVGAGCLLLLGRFSQGTLVDVARSLHIPLEKNAIAFSKQHPARPNLLITAMMDAAPQSLKDLDELQRVGVTRGEAIRMAQAAAMEMITFGVVLPPILKRALDVLINGAKAQQAGKVVGTVLGVALVGFFRFMTQYVKESRKNALSSQHKTQLAHALQELGQDRG